MNDKQQTNDDSLFKRVMGIGKQCILFLKVKREADTYCTDNWQTIKITIRCSKNRMQSGEQDAQKLMV